MDHEPFAARGLMAVSLLGDVVGTSLSLHSRRDTIDLVEDAALDRAGCLAAEIAWEWAERHRPDGPVTSASESAAGFEPLAVP